MKKIVTVALVCVLAFVTIGRAADSKRTALAEELLKVLDIQKNIELSFDMVKKMLPQQMKQSGGGASEADMQKMMDLIEAELSWAKLKDDYVAIYAETFTEEELAGMIKFYKSPIGQRFVEKQPELMQRTMQITQQQMSQLMPKIQNLVQGGE